MNFCFINKYRQNLKAPPSSHECINHTTSCTETTKRTQEEQDEMKIQRT